MRVALRHQDHLAFILDAHAAKPDKDGWATVTDNRMLTLYVAHDGVPLTVPGSSVVRRGALTGVFVVRTKAGDVRVAATGASVAAGSTTVTSMVVVPSPDTYPCSAMVPTTGSPACRRPRPC